MILLDTHVMVWLFDGEPKLGPRTLEAITAANAAESLWVSPISFWELAMLVGKNRLTLRMSAQAWVRTMLSRSEVRLAEITPDIAVAAGSLTGLHGDPGDRLVIATALALGAQVATRDRLILDYARQGHLQAIDARR